MIFEVGRSGYVCFQAVMWMLILDMPAPKHIVAGRRAIDAPI
jgi:hypothetical protein